MSVSVHGMPPQSTVRGVIWLVEAVSCGRQLCLWLRVPFLRACIMVGFCLFIAFFWVGILLPSEPTNVLSTGKHLVQHTYVPSYGRIAMLAHLLDISHMYHTHHISIFFHVISNSISPLAASQPARPLHSGSVSQPFSSVGAKCNAAALGSILQRRNPPQSHSASGAALGT
jgi:hypothetical protein